MESNSFVIYNASAGSGKTFTLAKNYLKLILESTYKDTFKNILAITFTNKAVGEMKTRIIENLADFAKNENAYSENYMFQSLCKEIGITPNELQIRATKVLQNLLHNYAYFDIATIDKFNHRIIRTFAFDLNLPQNFEVVLETELLLKKAVDNLIAKAGEDADTTKVLVDFVLEKVDDDKSWDISRDILDTSRMIVQENHYLPVQSLKTKTLRDFKNLGAFLKKEIQSMESLIKQTATEVLNRIHAEGIEDTDFTRKTLPSHFEKHISQNYGTDPYKNQLETNLTEGTKLYAAKLDSGKKATIDSLVPYLLDAYLTIKKLFYQIKFYKNIYNGLTPLSLLNAVTQELQQIKDDEGLMLISDFNATISETIKNQPAPFIYERIGEKFKHYFIDEFQDTSEMQWQNIIPLISNALSGETLSGKKGSLLLVGDAKQAIYRWRGGNPEQFIDMYNLTVSPFTVDAHIENLDTNYRSYDEVINFNNNFFNFALNAIPNTTYQNLYKLGIQKTNTKQGGYVSIEFVEKTEDTPLAESYLKATHNTIVEALANGYSYSDIAILTRKNSQGVLIADYLAAEAIPIISSETLLLKNNAKITFLNNLINFALYPENKSIKLELLLYLAKQQTLPSEHIFIQTHLDLANENTFKAYDFSINEFSKKDFYNAISYAIAQFDLAESSDAYLQFYLDTILEFTQKNNGGFSEFLSFWESKGNNLSLVAPEGPDAVSMLTIHRSKGLEFPVVIYPFADDALFDSRNKNWINVDPEAFQGFSNLYTSINNDFAALSQDSTDFKQNIDTKNILDSMNVVYVALTRAVKALYIITSSKSSENSLSGLFESFAAKHPSNFEANKLTFGNPQNPEPDKEKQQKLTESIPFGVKSAQKKWNIVTNNGLLWDTKQQKAIEKGNIIHDILAMIISSQDIETALDLAIIKGSITPNDYDDLKDILTEITQHPQLARYYNSESYTILTEKELITSSGNLLRPDRIMVNDHNVTIIDYKTGDYHKSHENQLNSYADVLKTCYPKHNITTLLLYIYPEISLKTVS